MSFGEAFGYPFKNIPKVLTVVLVFTILVALLVSNLFNTRSNSAAMLLTWGIIIAQSLFLTGYGIRVLRHIQDGYDYDMPSFEILGDIGRGIVVCFAGILTFIPLIALLFCGSTLVAGSQSYSYSPSVSPSTALLILLMIPFAVYLSWGFVVGMLRYASTEESGALFEFGTNFGYVNSNIGSSFGFLGYNFLLAIIYAAVNFLVTMLYEGVFAGTLTYRTDQTTLIAVVTVGYILSITISLFQQFAGLHLMAQYGEKIGITRETYGDEKMKY